MLGLIVSLVLMQAPDAKPTSAPAAAAPAATTPAASPAAAPAGTAPATKAAAKAGTATAAGAAADQPPPNLLTQILPFLPMVFLAYFMMIRPQQQQEKKRKEMLSKMGKNDRVMTTSGMYGTVVSTDPESDLVTLRLGSEPGVKVEFSRASIVRIIPPASDKDK
jgi:preprotein translocase subunit YajC